MLFRRLSLSLKPFLACSSCPTRQCLKFTTGCKIWQAPSDENVKKQVTSSNSSEEKVEKRWEEVFVRKTVFGLRILFLCLLVHVSYGYFFSYSYDLEHEEEMLAGVPGYMGYMLKVDPLYEERIEKLRRRKDKMKRYFSWV